MANKHLKGRDANKGKRIGLHESSDTNPGTQKPIFSLEHMVRGFCVASCDRDDKAAFADALHKRSQLTWIQLKQAPRHGLGSEKIEHSSLRVGKPLCLTEDTPILAFRFSGMKPMIGYRDGRIFNVLWLDIRRDVYDHS